jgi:hypothetical protein
MQTQHTASSDASNTNAPHASPPRIFTVKQFAQRNPAFSELSLRNLIFKSAERQSSLGLIPGNGLIHAGAIVRIGRKVLIDEPAFFKWVDSQKNSCVK